SMRAARPCLTAVELRFCWEMIVGWDRAGNRCEWDQAKTSSFSTRTMLGQATHTCRYQLWTGVADGRMLRLKGGTRQVSRGLFVCLASSRCVAWIEDLEHNPLFLRSFSFQPSRNFKLLG